MNRTRSSEDRRAAYKSGLAAEDIAAKHFQTLGFAIAAQRVRTASGEIDLIATNESAIVFIEVKRRRALDEAAFSISLRQQKRIAGAAMIWLAENRDHQDRDIRFDAVLLAQDGRTRHIEDAFRADGLFDI